MYTIPWTERVTNEEVLDRIKDKRHLWKSIQSRRDKIIGHILKHESLLRTIFERELEGHVGWGRLRTKYMTQIIKDMNKRSYKDLKELSYNRKAWRAAIN